MHGGRCSRRATADGGSGAGDGLVAGTSPARGGPPRAESIHDTYVPPVRFFIWGHSRPQPDGEGCAPPAQAQGHVYDRCSDAIVVGSALLSWAHLS